MGKKRQDGRGRGGWSSRVEAARLWWCDNCGVPLTVPRCSRCSGEGRPVPLSPPGDARPALRDGLALLNTILLRDFCLPQKKTLRGIVLFNKISGVDRADHVIVDGHLFGSIQFDPLSRAYSLSLTAAGASMLLRAGAPGIEFARGQGGRHIKGKHLPFSEFRFEGKFPEDRDILIYSGNTVAVGRYSLTEKGPAVRVRDAGPPAFAFSEKTPALADAADANRDELKRLEMVAVREIVASLSDKAKPLTVSFSGGKDSLVALELALLVRKDITVLFSDTGLEYPETGGYIRGLLKRQGLRLLIGSAGNAFWDNLPSFGLPAKDFRWCCKVCKLAPMTELIRNNFPGGCYTVEGRRRNESFARQNIRLVEESPFVPLQTNIEPIRDWTALHVWLYIFWHKLMYNPLYDNDLERIGCWLCPATLESEFETLRRTHPAMHARWTADIVADARKKGTDERAARAGLWRWKVLPPKMKELAGLRKIPLQDGGRADAELAGASRVSPCLSGGFSLEATLRTPGSAPLSRVVNLLSTMGDVKYNEDMGVAIVKSGQYSARLFESGQIAVDGPDPAKVRAFLRAVVGVVLRAGMCSRCGICVRTCPHGALGLGEFLVLDAKKCDRCGKCGPSCVLVRYADKLVDGPAMTAKSL